MGTLNGLGTLKRQSHYAADVERQTGREQLLGMERSIVQAALDSTGRRLSTDGWGRLSELRRWLTTEAVTGGGIGPAETARIDSRHLADSVLFALPWRGREAPPSLLDVGSGVGLPGLVLAIVLDETQVVLLDRSQRRCDLAARAVRVLGLENVDVVQIDAVRYKESHFGVVMRAVVPPLDAVPIVSGLLEPGGSGVIGLSRKESPEISAETLDAAHRSGCAAAIVEQKVLDLTAWLLIMTRS